MRTARVDAYDPATNIWTRKADIPTPRGGSGAAVLGNVIVVVGGEGNSAAGTRGIFAVTEEFDPGTNQWRSLAAPLTPRHGAYAVGIDGKLYWAGGAVAQGGGPDTAVFEIFSY
jgi:N-acetylneuraminic acid mutarotase